MRFERRRSNAYAVKATREKAETGAPRPQTVRKQAVRDGLIAAPKKKRGQIRKAAVTPQVA